jgi:hypothetical protein
VHLAGELPALLLVIGPGALALVGGAAAAYFRYRQSHEARRRAKEDDGSRD